MQEQCHSGGLEDMEFGLSSMVNRLVLICPQCPMAYYNLILSDESRNTSLELK